MILRALIRPPAANPADPRPGGRRRWRPLRRLAVWMRWFALRVFVLMAMLVGIYAFITPPTTLTIVGEARKRPITPRVWVDLGDVSPQMRRAVVAAEDANFCRHWGFDMDEIRRVVASGSSRGASTISQQTAKNVFLWQGRSWPRKALETVFTPLIEAFWSKRRILEVYLNLAEFGPGVFGIGAAAREFYGTTPDRLDAVQAARLAAVLPSPKTRDPRQASARSRSIADGAATIRRDGRADCF
ncbi:MAG TPA: monofunctional biosynthetic peptidoglycan transglycosylase [Paracoccus sp.]|nr:monofunctional biosynthetic peptidoglycan transglycosylase [Paracoccus sp. (in: a-proteobacteria)]